MSSAHLSIQGLPGTTSSSSLSYFEIWFLCLSRLEAQRARVSPIPFLSDSFGKWAAILHWPVLLYLPFSLMLWPILLTRAKSEQRWEGGKLKPSEWDDIAGTHWAVGCFSNHQNGFTMSYSIYSISFACYRLSPVNKHFKESVTAEQNVFHLAKQIGSQPIISSPSLSFISLMIDHGTSQLVFHHMDQRRREGQSQGTKRWRRESSSVLESLLPVYAQGPILFLSLVP